MSEADPSRQALMVSAIQAARLTLPSEWEGVHADCLMDWLMQEMRAKLDCR